MKAFPLPAMVACATCGFSMQSHGVMTGGAVVVACTGFECPEYNIQRKYQISAVDLLEIGEGDLIPIDVQPAKPVAIDLGVVEEPVPVVGTDPPPDTAPSETPV